VNWAIDMIENGYESEHLYILAGKTFPYNLFEIDDLVENTLAELRIKRPVGNEAINGYAYYLISEALSGNLIYGHVLQQLKNICITLDYYDPLYPFYLLHYAYDDLRDEEVQYYWEGADRSNIDSIVKNEFSNWISKFES
jgi:hypothetical protein